MLFASAALCSGLGRETAYQATPRKRRIIFPISGQNSKSMASAMMQKQRMRAIGHIEKVESGVGFPDPVAGSFGNIDETLLAGPERHFALRALGVELL